MGLRALAGKFAQLVVVLVIITFFTMYLTELLPGDAVDIGCTTCTEAQKDAFREARGLDKALVPRYVDWAGDMLHGDFGKYFSNGTPVRRSMGAALGQSAILMLYAQTLALVVAIPLGVMAAAKAGSIFDKIANGLAFGALSVPNFVLGLLLFYFVGTKTTFIPAGGYVPFRESPGQHFLSMLLPSVSLAVGQIAVYMRLLRSDMIATLQEDFVLMAKAKGLSPRRVLFRHALRPSSLTLLTVAGLNVGTLIGGAVVIEVIFGLSGLGKATVQAISSQETIALQSYVAVIGCLYVVINFLIDLLYTIVDPRIRSNG